MRNQTGIEKSATGTNSTQQESEEPHAEVTPQNGLLRLNNTPSKSDRIKWTREEYINVMETYYNALSHPSGSSTTQNAYDIWRKSNPDSRLYIDPNKLSNVRRYITKNKKLSDFELQNIKIKYTGNNPNKNTNVTDDGSEDATGSTVNTGENNKTANQEIEQHTIESPENSNVQEMMMSISRKWEITKETPIEKRLPIPKIKMNSKTKGLLETANDAIQNIKDDISRQLNLTELNELIYSTAIAITEASGLKTKTRKKKKIPTWKDKIKKEIEKLRSQLSILTEMTRGNNIKESKIHKIKKQLNIKKEEDIPTAIEMLKQCIQAKAQRLRRYTKRSNFYWQNKLFKENTKKLYRELNNERLDVHHPPNIKEVEAFWGDIWEKEKTHNTKAAWIQQQHELNKHVETQQWEAIDTTETTEAINRTQNWKAPGIDQLTNFWIKKITSVHSDLATVYNDIVENPEKAPKWLTTGITSLLPKTKETRNPKNYRPITCLPTTYKILTSIITRRLYSFLEENNLLPVEQKGCRKGSYGCKDQLLINKAILEEVKSRKKNLSTAWVDYKKAFDSVPHSWIEETLKIHKVCPKLMKFIKINMENWETTLNLHHVRGTLSSRPIRIKSGIFQGDSLSPLLFCLALAPLSNLLNSSSYGYTAQHGKLNHLFYVDDLKTFAKNESQQQGLLTIVKSFSDDINMEFGLEKCAKASFKRGKLVSTADMEIDTNTKIKDLEPDGTYKYLGVDEGDGIQHSTMKEKIRKEYYRRVRMILKTELNASNKYQALNSLAVPIVTYSFNIINWKQNELQKIDRKTRKMLTKERMHHPKADVDRIYLPRIQGGRGLTQLELTFKTTTIGLDAYLSRSDDRLLQLVKKQTLSIKNEAGKLKKNLQIPETPPTMEDTATSYARKIKQKAKEYSQKQQIRTWEDKKLHGQYPKRMKEADVDQQQTYRWLRSSGLKPETEGLIIAAQDQSLATRSYRHYIIRDGTDPMCRICGKFDETINHIISGCPELAKTDYIHRHDRVATYVHWKICQKYKLTTPQKWYEHQPMTVTESNDVTVLWDMPINTDREIRANRPDIIMKNKKENICTLIDVSVPSENNTSIKVAEKISKYKDLEIEINRMWGMKTIVLPIVIGALGLIKKGTEKFTDQVPGHISIPEIQKIALLGTAHILRKILSTKDNPL